MLPSDMAIEIQAHGFDDILAARIYQLMTIENRRLCSLGAFPFTEKFSTWTESVGTAGVPLTGAPTDIRAVRNLGLPGIQENNGNVTYLRKDYVEKTYGFNSYLLADYPRHYSVYGKNSTGGMNVYVWPYLTTALAMALDYHALPPVITAGTTELQMLLPEQYHGTLMDRVLARLSRSEGDLQDGDTYDARAREGERELVYAFETNQDSPDPMLFTPDDFFDT